MQGGGGAAKADEEEEAVPSLSLDIVVCRGDEFNELVLIKAGKLQVVAAQPRQKISQETKK